MDIYASDEEKGEEIKRWWRDNGRSVVVGAIIGIAIIFGGRFWVSHQQQTTQSASVIYKHVLMQLQNDDVEQAQTQTDELISNYAATPYAVFAAMDMAAHLAADESDTAQSYLEWVMTHAKLEGQVELARLRLARLLVAEQDFDAALALIETEQSPAFMSLYQELKGDIYVKIERFDDARQAYQLALSSVGDVEMRQMLLQMKLDDVAISHDS